MSTQQESAGRGQRCVLCLTCMNSVLRPDEPWRCAVASRPPASMWECDHFVKRFRQIPLVERRRKPRSPDAGHGD